MGINELMPTVNDIARDCLEAELIDERKKPEIHYERRYGLDIHVYYLRELGTITMALLLGENEGRYCREFTIPNNEVNNAIAHPELYAWDAGMPRRTDGLVD